jgi:hypothetical protein
MEQHIRQEVLPATDTSILELLLVVAGNLELVFY